MKSLLLLWLLYCIVANDDNDVEDDLLFKIGEDMTANLRESAVADKEKGMAVKDQLSKYSTPMFNSIII